MGTGDIIKTDLYAIHNIVQNTMFSYAKELIIETLREEFSKDSYYHYVRDVWGFPKTPDLTGTPVESGLHDDVTSRVFIGEAFRYDYKFFPAILVKGGSFKYVPISMSRNEGVLQYKTIKVVDGYGNEKLYSTPSHFSLAGAWEGTITIDILAGDVRARDDLIQIVSAIMTITNFKDMVNAGVIVKPISIGGPNETDNGKEKIYRQTISCDVRTEWRQKIPVESIVDLIAFCADFGDLSKSTFEPAPNIQLNTTIDLIDSIQNL